MTETTDISDKMMSWTSLLPWWVVLLWGLLSLIVGILFHPWDYHNHSDNIHGGILAGWRFLHLGQSRR